MHALLIMHNGAELVFAVRQLKQARIRARPAHALNEQPTIVKRFDHTRQLHASKPMLRHVT